MDHKKYLTGKQFATDASVKKLSTEVSAFLGYEHESLPNQF
jgi:hypothetical protein